MMIRGKQAGWRISRAGKIFFDYALTIVGTVIISPLLLAVALYVRLDSPGPIIFRQRRVGKNGKEFSCYKFRTMTADAEERLENLLEKESGAREEWNRDFKLKRDPRVTQSGKFLRKTSLDELPQIFNVLKGEMSLVGPRPVTPPELDLYGDYLSDYLSVRPGITGLWQVSGRNDTAYEERVQMDSWYVRNWSLRLDFALLLKTAKAVFSERGAY